MGAVREFLVTGTRLHAHRQADPASRQARSRSLDRAERHRRDVERSAAALERAAVALGDRCPGATGERSTPNTPTIAIVDSGIAATRSDVAGRVLGQVNLASLPGNTPTGDGYGHGTFVAGIAAGSAPGYAGAAPTANLLSVDIMNDQGQATVADVVAAADWILQNKSTYNIKRSRILAPHPVSRASIKPVLARSTRQSRSCGSTASRSWPPRATTRSTARRAACSSRRATIRSSSRSGQRTSARASVPATTSLAP